MATTFVYKTILIFGFLSLFHSAYSAAQHRSYLRITEQEFVSLPVDIRCFTTYLSYGFGTDPNKNIERAQYLSCSQILVQGIISLFLTMYGLMFISGEFKEIRATVDLETKSWETLRNIPSFYVFSHRGRALSPNYVPPLQKAILEEIDS
ncbi:unnamed protein product, partial [Timema podura]|nr:unnamed protein product [Timema podura]